MHLKATIFFSNSAKPKSQKRWKLSNSWNQHTLLTNSPGEGKSIIGMQDMPKVPDGLHQEISNLIMTKGPMKGGKILVTP